jgi:hypothetical protein
MPEGVEWRDWPVLEVLQAESGISVGKLRSRLASVPCYRCTDKSVRYEPAAARQAIADRDDVEDDDDATEIDAATLSTNSGVFSILAMLLREQMKMSAETRKERQDTIRVMQGPLETGLKLMESVVLTQGKRLEHLEGLWDRMVNATEAMLTQLHTRELERKRSEDSMQMRRQALGMLDKHGPMLWEKWSVTRDAQLAIEFLSSLDPVLVETVAAAGVLTPEQAETLAKLRASLDSRRKPPQHQHAHESQRQAYSPTEPAPPAPPDANHAS